MAYDVGQTYRATLVCTQDGAPVTPSAATLNVTLGLDAPIAVSWSQAAPGLLQADYQFAKPGLHKFAWQTQAPGITQTDYVSARAFAALCSLDDARAFLGVQDTRRDQLIRTLMAAACRLTERVVGTCVIRQFTGVWIGGQQQDGLRMPDGPLPNNTSITSIASVWPGGPSWATADLVINADAGTCYPKSGLGFWYGPWRADYTAGRIEISEDIELGNNQILWDLWATQRALTMDSAEPDLETVGLIEASYRISTAALEYLSAEQRPGFA